MIDATQIDIRACGLCSKKRKCVWAQTNPATIKEPRGSGVWICVACARSAGCAWASARRFDPDWFDSERSDA